MINNSEEEKYVAYLHQCFSNAVKRLQNATNTPEKLQKETLRLERLSAQASMHSHEVEVAQARAMHKYDNVRYIG